MEERSVVEPSQLISRTWIQGSVGSLPPGSLPGAKCESSGGCCSICNKEAALNKEEQHPPGFSPFRATTLANWVTNFLCAELSSSFQDGILWQCFSQAGEKAVQHVENDVHGLYALLSFPADMMFKEESSEQSILAVMTRFVQAVNAMDETVLIPMRLKDLPGEPQKVKSLWTAC